MYVVLVIAMFTACLVTFSHGAVAGLAAGAATFAAIFALLWLLGRRALGDQVAPAYVPDGDALASPGSDRPLPGDLLPVRVDLGGAPCCWSWVAATWIKGDAARDVFEDQLYDRLRRALAEPDAPAPSGADDLATYAAALRDPSRLFAFRSREAGWGGFARGGASFRFPLERLAALRLRIGHPGRGTGGYELCLVLADGDERALETHLPCNLRTTASLLIATMRLGTLFDVRVGCEEYVDDERGTEASRPYDR